MLKAIGQDAQRERLNMGNGIVPALAVRHDARQIRDFGQPPAVVFPLDLYLETQGHRYGPFRAKPESNARLGCRLTNRASAAGARFAGAPCARSFYGTRQAHKRNSSLLGRRPPAPCAG